MTEMSTTPDTAVEQKAAVRPKARWPRRLVLGMALVSLLGAILGPRLLSRLIRAQIELRGSEFIEGTVTLDELSFALNGKAQLAGLTVTDANGDVVAFIPSAKLDLGLRSLFSGRLDVALLIDGADIVLARDADGRWNIEELLGEAAGGGEGADPPDGPRPGEPPSREPPPRKPPAVHGRLEIVNSTVVIRSTETALELRDLHFTIGLDGPEKETAVRFDATLVGRDGDAGVLHADVFLWPDAGPGLRIEEVSAREVDLRVVEQALLLVGAPLEDGGRLIGKADLVARGSLADLDPDSAFSLEVDGSVRDLDVALFSEGVESFALEEDAATLELRATGDGGGAEPRATAQLRGRDGRLGADVEWDGAADAGLVLALDIDGLEANAGLAPYLARIHPAFAGANSLAGAVDGAELGGLVSSQLEFRYDAPLPMASFAEGADGFSTDALKGTGSLTVDEGLVRTSAFFGKVLEAFGEPANPSFSLQPLGFAVDAGRITYAQPWTWTIQGSETQFIGSVGLDRSLDLNWIVPVTGSLAQQNSVFEAIAGETFEVALGGTLTRPRFDLSGALSSLARRVGEDKLQETLQKELGNDAGADAIRGVLDGDFGALDDAARRLIGTSGEPDVLFKEANRLWDEGKRSEAAKIYSRIRKEFPFSPTYLLNKSKIKGRRNG